MIDWFSFATNFGKRAISQRELQNRGRQCGLLIILVPLTRLSGRNYFSPPEYKPNEIFEALFLDTDGIRAVGYPFHRCHHFLRNLRLTLHRWRFRVLDLHPMLAPTDKANQAISTQCPRRKRHYQLDRTNLRCRGIRNCPLCQYQNSALPRRLPRR